MALPLRARLLAGLEALGPEELDWLLEGQGQQQEATVPAEPMDQQAALAANAIARLRTRGAGNLALAKDELARIRMQLDQEIQGKIAEDYEPLVQLSQTLARSTSAVAGLAEPLEQAESRARESATLNRELLDTLNAQWREKEELGEKRAILELFVYISELVAKIERLLGLSEMHQQGATTSTTAPSRSVKGGKQQHQPEGVDSSLSVVVITDSVIERVTNEFNHLRYVVQPVRGLPFVQGLADRIERIQDHLQHSLQRVFRESLERGDTEQLGGCLRTYAAIDRCADAEHSVSEWVVRPFCQTEITPERVAAAGAAAQQEQQQQPKSLSIGGDASSDGVSVVFEACLAFIRTKCKPLLDLTNPAVPSDDAVSGFDFLANSIWKEIASSIVAQLPRIFSPAFPDAFKRNYSSAVRLLQAVETEFCHSTQAVQTLYELPETAAFLKKWNLAVYFQLRVQETAAPVENSIAEFMSAPVRGADSAQRAGALQSAIDAQRQRAAALIKELVPLDRQPSSSLHYVPSAQVLASLCRTWNQEVYLDALLPRFAKLSVQLLARHGAWCRRMAGGEQALHTSSDLPQPKPTQLTAPGKQTDTVPSLPLPACLSLPQKLALCEDALNMHLWSVRHFEHLASICGDQAPAVAKLMEVASWQFVSEASSAFVRAVVAELADRLDKSLEAVRGVASAYRHTNRAVSDDPSAYVATLVDPLRELVQATANFKTLRGLKVPFEVEQTQATKAASSAFGRPVTERMSVHDRWIRLCLQRLCEQYSAIIQEILASVRQSEESLRKLRGGAAASAGHGVAQHGSLSDSDKILLQLFMDVEHFGRQWVHFNLELPFEPYTKLLETVGEAAEVQERLRSPNPAPRIAPTTTLATTEKISPVEVVDAAATAAAAAAEASTTATGFNEPMSSVVAEI